ncbi:MAG TPA: hypothetical protein PLO89_10685, partial [Spirochaetota bacterium]|nr:hypothetical protein [Spirochaetota bacterium]
MKNLLIFIIFLFFTFSLFSQSFGKKENIKYLFLNSYPIRAKVFFDGKDTNTLTPCVIKNINPDVKISVKKNGYNEYFLTKSDMGLRKFDINLIPSSFDLYFPERVFYKLGSTETKGPVYVSKLKSGQYDMSVSGDKIIFRKTSNFLPAYVGLGTAFGISLASTAILIGVAEYCNFNANEAKISGETALSPKRFHYEETTKNIDTYAKIPAISLTGVLFAALISVIITDAVLQYNYKKEEMEVSDKTPSSQDGMFYDTALQYLGSGE